MLITGQNILQIYVFQFKQINQPDATVLQLYYLMFCVAQHVLGTSAPIIRSLQLH